MSAFASRGPWLFDRRTDLLAFGGSAALALALLGGAALFGAHEAALPEGLWLLCIVGVDVAHVWSTAFRVYLDGDEVRRRPGLYVVTPFVIYVAAVALHAWRPGVFWTALAYMAVFHFVRQQAGWVTLYRRRERAYWVDAVLDRGAIYAATLYPLLWWHGHLPRSFHWMIAGDFVAMPAGAVVEQLAPLYHGALLAFGLRQLWRWRRGWGVSAGKVLVVGTTAACWWIGIIGLDGDLAFSVTNVLIHGLPYLVLTYRDGRHRSAPAIRVLLRYGAAGFLALVLTLAFLEEMLWDRFVWHERPWLFGASKVALGALGTTLFVPLLALPQLTHYVLDGFVWRRRGNP